MAKSLSYVYIWLYVYVNLINFITHTCHHGTLCWLLPETKMNKFIDLLNKRFEVLLQKEMEFMLSCSLVASLGDLAD